MKLTKSKIDSALDAVFSVVRTRRFASVLPGSGYAPLRRQISNAIRNRDEEIAIPAWVMVRLLKAIDADLVDGRSLSTVRESVGRRLREVGRFEWLSQKDRFDFDNPAWIIPVA